MAVPRANSAIKPQLWLLLLLAVLLALLPGFVLATWRYWNERQTGEARVREEAGDLARLVAANQSRAVEGVRQALVVLAILLNEGDGLVDCAPRLARLQQRLPRYTNLGVVRPDGSLICSAIPADPAINLGDRYYVRQALATRDFVIGEFQIGRITGRPSINFGYPVLGPNGEIQGVVFAAFDLDWFQSILTDVALPSYATATIVDRNGTVLASTAPNQVVGQPLDMPETSQPLNPVESLESGYVALNGEAGVMAMEPLLSAADSTTAVIVHIPLASAVERANRLLVGNLIALVLVGSLGLLLSLLGIRWLVLRPIQTMVQATTHLATGDLKTRVIEKTFVREIDALSSAFNQMAASLQQRDQALLSAQQQALQQEHLRVLGEMASGVVHDFNNSLSTLLGFSELLHQELDTHPSSERAARYLEHIIQGAQNAHATVERLRAFSRPREPGEKRQPVNLNQIVEETVELTQPRWQSARSTTGRGLQIVCDLQATGTILANAGELRDALMNLIFNAVDAMPDGGTITIQTSDYPPASIRLTIKDEGIGMTPEVYQRCFQPFFTTKGKQGTGLGLPMVYGMVQRHNGTIEVITAPGAGTTVIITLPRA